MIYQGDCLDILPTIEANSIDSIVTDPPYGLSFMGKDWDYGVPGVHFWVEALRVAKPGAYLLAFGGTRTFHRLTCAIEDAGWEIRDCIGWLYGSGFPKSLDVSKAIDKATGATRVKVATGKTIPDIRANNYENSQGKTRLDEYIDQPATEAAKQWEGWGTALKPSHEDIIVAQKPLTPFMYCAIMIQNLSRRIESCKQNANGVEKSSGHSRAESQGEKIGFAVESVEIKQGVDLENKTEIGVAEDINLKADISELIPEAERIALNTLLSWRNTLGACFDQGRMSTTEMGIEATIDWKTLNYCLLQITQEDITPDEFCRNGLSASASNAARYFSATLDKLKATQELSALGLALSKDAINCQEETGLPNFSPNFEPIIVARKPIIGTVANNILKYGTGGMNIDGCRVDSKPRLTGTRNPLASSGSGNCYLGSDGKNQMAYDANPPAGRWPANLIHDGSEEVLAVFPVTGVSAGGRAGHTGAYQGGFKQDHYGDIHPGFGDSGSAARFFYCAKASKQDRDEGNGHPTVKPTALMRYLCRLVTPPGGTILDPFMGSGSTGKAAALEGFNFIGIELEKEYAEIADKRINNVQPLFVGLEL